MKPPGVKYGRDLSGAPIKPKDGERIIPEGEHLPEVHRAWINGSGWLSLTKKLNKHPGANQTAQVFGNYWCYAVPLDESLQPVQPEVAKPVEAVLAIPEPVAEEPAAPVKRRSLPREVNMIEFDDE
jgi:hypothetical protein